MLCGERVVPDAHRDGHFFLEGSQTSGSGLQPHRRKIPVLPCSHGLSGLWELRSRVVCASQPSQSEIVSQQHDEQRRIAYHQILQVSPYIPY